jgi:hypothetical protein
MFSLKNLPLLPIKTKPKITNHHKSMKTQPTFYALALYLTLFQKQMTAGDIGGWLSTAWGWAETVSGISGELYLDGDISKYTRSITTNYKGVKIEQRWEAEQNRRSGNWRYLYTCESKQFTDQTSIVKSEPFEIGENGSRYSDVPLEVRNFSCSYSYPEGNGTFNLYSIDNQTEFQVRVNAKYGKSPWLGGATARVSANLINWTEERQNCHPVNGFPIINTSFWSDIPANGVGYIKVQSYKRDGKWINLSHGEGAGFGFISL